MTGHHTNKRGRGRPRTTATITKLNGKPMQGIYTGPEEASFLSDEQVLQNLRQAELSQRT